MLGVLATGLLMSVLILAVWCVCGIRSGAKAEQTPLMGGAGPPPRAATKAHQVVGGAPA